MKLFFARHGESEANIIHEISNRGYRHGLTEKGCQQAHSLAETLVGHQIACIYSSPLQRAVETAEIVAQALAIPCQVTPALREFDCGIAEGRGDSAAWDLWQWVWDEWQIHRRYASRIEDGESFEDLRARFLPLVQNLLDGPDQNTLLVSHGGLYGTMLPEVLVNWTQFPERSIPNTAYILAEKRPEGLLCLEWCGQKPIVQF